VSLHLNAFLQHVQRIAFGVRSNLNLQSQSDGSLSNQTGQKRPKEQHQRLGFETDEITLQMY